LQRLRGDLIAEEGIIGIDDARAIVRAESNTAERVGQNRIASRVAKGGRRGRQPRRFTRAADDDPARLSRNLGRELVERRYVGNVLAGFEIRDRTIMAIVLGRRPW
jgi:hypothetical protein